MNKSGALRKFTMRVFKIFSIATTLISSEKSAKAFEDRYCVDPDIATDMKSIPSLKSGFRIQFAKVKFIKMSDLKKYAKAGKIKGRLSVGDQSSGVSKFSMIMMFKNRNYLNSITSSDFKNSMSMMLTFRPKTKNDFSSLKGKPTASIIEDFDSNIVPITIDFKDSIDLNYNDGASANKTICFKVKDNDYEGLKELENRSKSINSKIPFEKVPSTNKPGIYENNRSDDNSDDGVK